MKVALLTTLFFFISLMAENAPPDKQPPQSTGNPKSQKDKKSNEDALPYFPATDSEKLTTTKIALAGALAGVAGGIAVAGINAIVAFFTRGHERAKHVREIAMQMTLEQWKTDKERWETWRTQHDAWKKAQPPDYMGDIDYSTAPKQPPQIRPLSLIFAEMMRLADLIAEKRILTGEDLALHIIETAEIQAAIKKHLNPPEPDEA